ncbi:MAG: ATP-binding protein [Spirochaetales bacterium]|jgi:AAA+ ATPase superfamily predicted ATPase|nr:ATP-binding protein [Spirochaetales bacterium]
MFIGRKNELEELERLHKTGVFQFVIIYGRRRVGKSTLLSHFTQDKRTIFFTAIESDSRRNLELFSRMVMKLRDIRSEAAFASWERAFEEVEDLAKEPLILVIDEYPYLAQAERSISSILQHYCDQFFKQRPVMIILCGSSMSFMENQVLGYQSPLYGRRTAQMKIASLGFVSAAAFVPRYSLEEKALVFGITGGIPKYLELFSDSLSLKENIIRNYLTPAGYLYEEPSNLLKQELREPAKYNLIIEAVAKGASRLNEIATRTGLDTSAASNYIASLISLGIMQKETAITEEKNKRKTLYRLADTMFVFWYRYVFGAEFSILTGDAASLFDTEIFPDLRRFMGPVFETMCAEYVGKANLANRLPFKVRQLGRWWGTNPETRSEEEIDLVGINDKESKALFCECKYRNQLCDIHVLNALMEKAGRWQNYKNKYFMLFSKSGFTQEVLSTANQSKVQLVSLEEMY